MGAWSGHYIVCGGNSLAYRLVAELVEHYEVPVVAIVPDRERGHAPRIEQLPGVTAVVAFNTVTDEALRAVNIAAARGIALVDGDDQSNIHTALAAQGRNPDLRIVLRMFNQRLGEQIEKLLKNCTALSGSATSSATNLKAVSWSFGSASAVRTARACSRAAQSGSAGRPRRAISASRAGSHQTQSLGAARISPAARSTWRISSAARAGSIAAAGPTALDTSTTCPSALSSSRSRCRRT